MFFFNYFLLTNNTNIQNKINQINLQIQDITNYLQNNAIIRIPQFNEENCQRSIQSDADNNLGCGEIILSEPQLDPFSTQNYLVSKHLNQKNNIKIYNVNLIKYVDSEDLYLLSDVSEVDIEEKITKGNFFELYKTKYFSLFNNIQRYFDKKEILKNINPYIGDIALITEAIKKQKSISKIFEIEKNNLLFTKLSPITKNNNIYGVVLINGNLIQENTESGLTSFNLLNLFLIIVFFMFFLSFFFSKSIINPIKALSVITKKERDKFINYSNNLQYPVRNDEIGILSIEIENMSKDLKLRINELENFAADVSHELKNPLASLKSANELLINNKITTKDKLLLLQNIRKDVEKMNNLISDISNYTRTQAEINEELFSEFDLIEFINELADSFSNNKKSIKLKFEFEKSPIIIKLNRDKLAQVFINLINNSLSFAPSRSFILIRQLFEDDNVIFYIVDQGKGVDFSLQKKIFERFYSDRSYKFNNRFEHHSGLGLSISKKIIESFAGSIELISYQPEGYKGACFKLKLPLKD